MAFFNPITDPFPAKINDFIYAGFDRVLPNSQVGYKGHARHGLGHDRCDPPDFYNQSLFALKLFRYYVNHMTVANMNDCLMKNIRAYFLHSSLRQHNPLSVRIEKKISFNMPFIAYQTALQALWLELLTQFSIRYNLRDPARIHHKFFRRTEQGRASILKGDSKKLLVKFMEIQNNLDRAVSLKNKSTRSVIIAINRFFNHNPDNTKLQFGLGNTILLLEVKKNHGQGLISVNTETIIQKFLELETIFRFNPYFMTREALSNMLQRFLYHSNLVKLLEYTGAQLIHPPMYPQHIGSLITERFSRQIQAFYLEEFKSGTSELLVNFLNGFAFLSQIFEVARYLPDSPQDDRPITDLPIATALEVVKNNPILQAIYGGALIPLCLNPVVIRGIADKPDQLFKTIKQLGDTLSDNSPAKIKLKISEDIDDTEDVEFDFEPVQSARATQNFLKEHYGTGNESDTDDSVYSISDYF